jgi:hypothetical protein
MNAFLFHSMPFATKKTLENNPQTPLDMKILAIPTQHTFEST